MSELKATVENAPNIFEIHFDADGVHYFNTWKAVGMGDEKFGKFVNGVPILSSRIVETKTREEVLGIRRNFDTTDKTDFVAQTLENKEAKKEGVDPKKIKERK